CFYFLILPKMYVNILCLTLMLALTCVSAQVPPFTEKCVQGTYPPDLSRKVPTVIINLDLKPQDRWTHVVKDMKPQIEDLLVAFKSFIRDFGNWTEAIIKLVDNDFGYLADELPAPYGDELKGIATASGLPLGEVVLYNIFYEIFTVCTSIVGQDLNGRMYHARNLDFGLFLGWDIKNNTWEITEKLRPTIRILEFQRSGKTLYKTVNYLGYIGVLTGIRPGVFTLTMNERFNIDGGFVGIFEWLLGNHTGQWMSFLTRDTLEQAASYDDAKDRLANTPMLAPAYYILGGTKPGQGCVITRSRQKAIDVWEMSSQPANSWYILETNYDHWKKPMFLDDRRTPANKCMQKLTQKGMGIAGIYDVLSSKPVLNKLTTYTALMQVDSGHLECWLQYCPDPCYPF
ncbi:unnamed protein product, partial [Owenia fusiformis]